MTLPRDLLATYRAEILVLADKYGIASVKVFGSVARGEDTPSSDIDLLIDLVRPVEDGFAFLSFQQEIEDLTGKKVDILFERGIFPAMRQSILREAQPV